jgi:hypothetical protein
MALKKRMGKGRKVKPSYGGWIMPKDDDFAPNGKRKVHVKLVGEDGNAYAIIARCHDAMRKAGWSIEEIKEFDDKMTGGDYNHLLVTALEYTC